MVVFLRMGYGSQVKLVAWTLLFVSWCGRVHYEEGNNL